MRISILKIIVICLAVLFSQTSFASRVGNGGGAWICQSLTSPNVLQWIRLVDLYEASDEFKLGLPEHKGKTYLEIIDTMRFRIFKVDKDFYSQLETLFDEVDKNITYVEADLQIVDDALYRIKPLPSSCPGGAISYTQLANYTDYGKILIRSDLFNDLKLSELDKAALILHEVIYKYARATFGDKDSVRSRKIVGLVFSDLNDDTLRNSLAHLVNKPESSVPEVPTQEYFKPNRTYFLESVVSIGEGTSPYKMLVLQGDQEVGWLLQLSGNESVTMLPRPTVIDINEKIGDQTWAGERSIYIILKNGKFCTFDVSFQVNFRNGIPRIPDGWNGKDLLDETSYAEVTLYWPRGKYSWEGLDKVEACEEAVVVPQEFLIEDL